MALGSNLAYLNFVFDTALSILSAGIIETHYYALLHQFL
jgi:hypothetical protein